MQDRGVVAAAEQAADLSVRLLPHVPEEIHRHVPGVGDLFLPAGCWLGPRPGMPVHWATASRMIDGSGTAERGVEVIALRASRGEVTGDRLAVKTRQGRDSRFRAPSSWRMLSCTRCAISSSTSSGDVEFLEFRPGAQDGEACLHIGRGDIDDQAPLEARAQPFLESEVNSLGETSLLITICLFWL